MKFVQSREFMINSLNELLEPGEALETPFYGGVEKSGWHNVLWFCYFGIAEGMMLMAKMNPLDVSKCTWAVRMPLSNIKSVRHKPSLVPHQTLIRVKFFKGDNLVIRAYKKVLAGDIGNQALNIERFIEKISPPVI